MSVTGRGLSSGFLFGRRSLIAQARPGYPSSLNLGRQLPDSAGRSAPVVLPGNGSAWFYPEARGRDSARPALYFPGRPPLAYRLTVRQRGNFRTASKHGVCATTIVRRTRSRRALPDVFAPRCVVSSVEARSRGIPASVVVGRTSRTALVSPADSSRPGTAGEI